MANEAEVAATVNTLVETALAHSGRDNISVVIAEVAA
jgi:serine/threonine protein phosphatase PrpC